MTLFNTVSVFLIWSLCSVGDSNSERKNCMESRLEAPNQNPLKSSQLERVFGHHKLPIISARILANKGSYIVFSIPYCSRFVNKKG